MLAVENSREGFRALVERIREDVPLEQCFPLLEVTGHYHRPLVQYLLELDLPVYLMHVQARPLAGPARHPDRPGYFDCGDFSGEYAHGRPDCHRSSEHLSVGAAGDQRLHPVGDARLDWQPARSRLGAVYHPGGRFRRPVDSSTAALRLP